MSIQIDNKTLFAKHNFTSRSFHLIFWRIMLTRPTYKPEAMWLAWDMTTIFFTFVVDSCEWRWMKIEAFCDENGGKFISFLFAALSFSLVYVERNISINVMLFSSASFVISPTMSRGKVKGRKNEINCGCQWWKRWIIDERHLVDETSEIKEIRDCKTISLALFTSSKLSSSPSLEFRLATRAKWKKFSTSFTKGQTEWKILKRFCQSN